MAMGRRKRERQGRLRVEAVQLLPGSGHRLYRPVNEVSAEHGLELDRGCVRATLRRAEGSSFAAVRGPWRHGLDRYYLEEVSETLADLFEDEEAKEQMNSTVLAEVVAHPGYQSNAILRKHAWLGIRTSICEPDRGHRHRQDKEADKAATYANRERRRSARGRRLLRSRSERVERNIAHA